MTAQPLRFGIVGCGGAALDFVRGAAATPTAAVVAVHDLDERRATDLAGTTGARFHRRFRELLADPDVDAVYVALPHDRLVPTSLAALRAGRHVLVEKPAATTLAGIDRLAAAARHADRGVGVLFEHRQSHAATTARALVRGGAIGDVRLVRIRTLIDKPPAYWNSGPTGRATDPWRASLRRSGGGVVLMNTSHQLDLVRAVTGLEVEAVAARTGRATAGVEVEDEAVAVLAYAGGALGSLVASAHAPGAVRAEGIEIDGTHGALVLPDPYGPARPLRLYLRRPWGGHPSGRWLEVGGPERDAWAQSVEAFAEAIADRRPPEPGLDDARAALATVLAIYRAARRPLVRVRR